MDAEGARRGRLVQAVLLIVLGCNLLISAVKITLGLATRMQSVTADGYHSITDGFSNIIGLIGIRIASRPRDADHAYGHSRYETLSSLAIVALLVYLGVSVLERSVTNLIAPDFRIPTGVELALIALTLVFNIFVAVIEEGAGRHLASPILTSDARHTLSDVWVTCGVLASIVLMKYAGAPAWTDSAVSLGIALLIFRTAYGIFHTAADELTDHIAVDPERIAEVVLSDPDVLGVHKVRSRRSGDVIFADFHVQCDPDMRLRDVHAMTHRIEALLNERLGMRISCVIHTEDERPPRPPGPRSAACGPKTSPSPGSALEGAGGEAAPPSGRPMDSIRTSPRRWWWGD